MSHLLTLSPKGSLGLLPCPSTRSRDEMPVVGKRVNELVLLKLKSPMDTKDEAAGADGLLLT